MGQIPIASNVQLTVKLAVVRPQTAQAAFKDCIFFKDSVIPAKIPATRALTVL